MAHNELYVYLFMNDVQKKRQNSQLQEITIVRKSEMVTTENVSHANGKKYSMTPTHHLALFCQIWTSMNASLCMSETNELEQHCFNSPLNQNVACSLRSTHLNSYERFFNFYRSKRRVECFEWTKGPGQLRMNPRHF